MHVHAPNHIIRFHNPPNNHTPGHTNQQMHNEHACGTCNHDCRTRADAPRRRGPAVCGKGHNGRHAS
eukprot:239243-Chlamydomonas_euryale.AAC.1